MTFHFFKNVNSVEEAKKAYRKLAKDNHPDRGGDTETMKKINIEYEHIMKHFDVSANESEAFKSIIDQLNKFEGITIEIIGTWVWVYGTTFPIKSELKEMSFKYSKNKTAWYWHDGEYYGSHKKKFSMDEIRDLHKSKVVKSSQIKSLAGA